METKELGEVLRSCRFRAGLTQSNLAQVLHLDRSYISRIEKGEKEPRFTTVKLWVDVTGCHEHFVSVLMSRDEWKGIIESLDKLEKIQAIVTEPIA